MRNCLTCDGTGIRESFWKNRDSDANGKPIPESWKLDSTCNRCSGVGTFAPLDVPAIVAAITVSRGKTKGKLKASRPKESLGARAYYVWRLARFHGGADVCLPMFANLYIAGDPYRAELDALADVVAKRAFGTNLAAAYRWSGALGRRIDPPEGLPPTAYPLGPVRA